MKTDAYTDEEVERLVELLIDQLIKGSTEYDFDADGEDYDDCLVSEIREYVLTA